MGFDGYIPGLEGGAEDLVELGDGVEVAEQGTEFAVLGEDVAVFEADDFNHRAEPGTKEESLIFDGFGGEFARLSGQFEKFPRRIQITDTIDDFGLYVLPKVFVPELVPTYRDVGIEQVLAAGEVAPDRNAEGEADEGFLPIGPAQSAISGGK